MKDRNVLLTEQLKEDLQHEDTIISPMYEQVGFALMSHVQDNQHVLRIFQLLLMEDDQYHPVQELEAYSFPTRREMEDFMNHLPGMTALELLLLQNPLPFGGGGDVATH